MPPRNNNMDERILPTHKAIGGGSGVKNECWAYMKVFHITSATLFTELKKLAPNSNGAPSKLGGH